MIIIMMIIIGVWLPPRPGLLVGVRGPAAHGHDGRGEALELQVADVGLRAAAEDAVDVAGDVRLRGEAAADEGRDLPADVFEGPRVVAGPHHREALRPGPALDRPDEAARVAVLLEAGRHLLAGLEYNVIENKLMIITRVIIIIIIIIIIASSNNVDSDNSSSRNNNRNGP